MNLLSRFRLTLKSFYMPEAYYLLQMFTFSYPELFTIFVINILSQDLFQYENSTYVLYPSRQGVLQA